MFAIEDDFIGATTVQNSVHRAVQDAPCSPTIVVLVVQAATLFT